METSSSGSNKVFLSFSICIALLQSGSVNWECRYFLNFDELGGYVTKINAVCLMTNDVSVFNQRLGKSKRKNKKGKLKLLLINPWEIK